MKKKIFSMIVLLLLPICLVISGGQAETSKEETAGPTGAVSAEAVEYDYVDPHTAKFDKVMIAGFKEAPELAKLVAAGKLPPVEERLPEVPLVVKPIEELGKYGGTMIYNRRNNKRLTRIARGPDNMNYEFFIHAKTPYPYQYYPNIPKSWEFSDDGKIVTFYLREGMKWSDGTPFTTQDVLFWYEDMYLDDDLFPTKWHLDVLTVGGEMAQIRAVDDYTLQFDFKEAPGLGFLASLRHFRPNHFQPKHYLSQFHPKYTSQMEIDKMIKEQRFESWPALFTDKCEWGGRNPDCPVVSAWVRANSYEELKHVWKRNPYYWKVDTIGQQLPYIDSVERNVTATEEATLLTVISGDFTWEYMWPAGRLKAYATVAQNAEKGDYRIIDTFMDGAVSEGTITFNYAHKDPAIRKMFSDKRFRQAFSMAIDREEINQLIYFGQLTNNSFGLPMDEYWHGDDPIYQKYIQRDVEKANQLLDEMGMTQRDGEGYRLALDGKKLELVIMVSGGDPEKVEMGELYKKRLIDAGIRVVTKPQTGSILGDKVRTFDFDLSLARYAFASVSAVVSYGHLLPADERFGIALSWIRWWETDGKEGAEPSEAGKRLREINQIIRTVDLQAEEERWWDLINEALAIHAEELIYITGIHTPLEKSQAYIVKNSLRNANVPGFPWDYLKYDIPAATLFFKY